MTNLLLTSDELRSWSARWRALSWVSESIATLAWCSQTDGCSYHSVLASLGFMMVGWLCWSRSRDYRDHADWMDSGYRILVPTDVTPPITFRDPALPAHATIEVVEERGSLLYAAKQPRQP
jgi:hypothetical protein